MNTAYLLIGGNLGDRSNNLQQAIEHIEPECGDIIAISSTYETAAWGNTDQPAFLNQVIVLNTDLQPGELMKRLLDIEKKLGRTRNEKMGPRTIDIDILLIEDQVIQTSGLIVPHPSLHLRKFALIPLAEVAGSRIHPTKNKTIAELLTDCPDSLPVTKIS
jgi:2-amino-4-hydroxy-6-hydroxymethyldihydropteridine diphosphokinase